MGIKVLKHQVTKKMPLFMVGLACLCVFTPAISASSNSNAGKESAGIAGQEALANPIVTKSKKNTDIGKDEMNCQDCGRVHSKNIISCNSRLRCIIS